MATISHDIIPDLYYLSFLSRKSACTLAEEGMVGGKTIAGIPSLLQILGTINK
jgi:hypothetical protein